MAGATIPELQLIADRFDQLYANQDFKTIVEEIYTADCRMLAPGREIITGKAEKEKWMACFYQDTGVQVKSTVLEILSGSDDTVTDRGSYCAWDEEGKETDVGKFICLRRKENGRWLIFLEIFNSDKP